jgi:EAL domain-containing protein (putative c-di-GMP-specific phosphodiesterase class I)
VAVNISAPNLLDAALPGDIARLLRTWGAPPALLQLEITETMVSADPEHVIAVLEQLRTLGVSLSLDDFGTGSSSLSFLRRLPVGELKIDKSFILGMGDTARDTAIVATINDLAHNLGLQTVAEGIETEEVRVLVRDLGCDHGQGFLMARPIPPEEILARVQESGSAWPDEARAA